MRGALTLTGALTGALTALTALLVGAGVGAESVRYGFYRDIRAGGVGFGGTRRVFGGEPARPEAFPLAVALLDRYWAAQCSAARLAPRWALTAAHCLAARPAYVRYAGGASTASHVAVLYVWRHPQHGVELRDEGRGLDVVALRHDVGLVRTRDDMAAPAAPGAPPLALMRAAAATTAEPRGQVRVLGFGSTGDGDGGGGGGGGGEGPGRRDQLFAVRLRLVRCERASWVHCVCAVAAGEQDGDGEGPLARSAGVCAGDSGGPALALAEGSGAAEGSLGAQVGVTSMGPVQCAQPEAALAPPEGATSVLTATAPYVDLLNATMRHADKLLARRATKAAAAAAMRSAAPPTADHLHSYSTLVWLTTISAYLYASLFLSSLKVPNITRPA